MAALPALNLQTSYSPTLFPGHNGRPSPKGVLKAQIKSRRRRKDCDVSLSEPDTSRIEGSALLERFFALPLELRNKIYQHLLVRPNKFNLPHLKPCNTPLPYSRPGPSTTSEFDFSPWPHCVSFKHCATCSPWPRNPQINIFTSPARSTWATTPQLNPYLCDNCYWDVHGRYIGNPCLRSLPCLCTRRTDLSILVVNKRIHDEAGPIFWGDNVFAFEHPCLMTGFLEALSPRTRTWLRRICFMPIHEGIAFREWPMNMDSIGDGVSNINGGDSRLGWGNMKRCWQLLRQCEGLVELELDVVFLKRVDWALLIRLIRAAKAVVFSRHPGEEEIREWRVRRSRGEEEMEEGLIWWSHSKRVAVQTETVDLLVGSMIGKRAVKAKVVKRHFAETSVVQRWGGNIYPDEGQD